MKLFVQDFCISQTDGSEYNVKRSFVCVNYNKKRIEKQNKIGKKSQKLLKKGKKYLQRNHWVKSGKKGQEKVAIFLN